ncbi:MAG: hypothetical protein GXP39_14185 [Chloroflexi bacterium]|nr:hypothetical protein [Chloroflexota bacterium]
MIQMPFFVVALLIGVILLETIALLWLYRGRREMHQSHRREAMEDFLKELYDLVPEGQAIGMRRLADAAHQAPSTLERMLEPLERAGWVVRQPAGDVRITEAGRARAIQLTRAHRLWERYLAEEEDVPLEAVHAEAHRREHSLTPEEADRLDEQLGFPTRDPHGDPIPDREGEMREKVGDPLTAWPEGKPALITHMEDEPPALFAQLLAMGLSPGVRLVIEHREGDRLRVRYDDLTVPLAPAAAERIFVQEAPPDAVPLSSLRVGQQGVVVEVQETGKTLRRMLDMGLVPGAEVEVVRTAPLGDPIQYRVKGASISLRRREAARILVMPQDGLPTD